MTDKRMYQLERSDAYAILGGREMTAGVIQHPDTGHWQTWLNVDGQTTINISAHRERSDAEDVVIALGEAYRSQDLSEPASMNALIDQLTQQADATPEPLPEQAQREVERLVAQIRRREP